MTPDLARLMATYNSWQNASLYDAAETLTPADRLADRGAFFGSIQGTLNHLLWGDQIWMSRFDGWEKPAVSIAGSTEICADWSDLRAARIRVDAGIAAWAAGLTEERLAQDLTWFSGAAGRELTRPMWQLVAHLFNHQTHHRGQAHALLTAAGARPADTDLMLLTP
ncbi:putative damage-inducible protein DinB [Caulobacter ginsengisoli]|uniref:Damage-inducible protein DinB n=1 Tax=Caulobacter ginsengisoli TaxID=400775 RepID=A0ABU0IQD3_9CAUL|nr:DinB family protein [Caulobacter ginsengisoli]MDQ0463157.1 putative damage-inducible protein DinB [Caulobacter ginsengisoli]